MDLSNFRASFSGGGSKHHSDLKNSLIKLFKGTVDKFLQVESLFGLILKQCTKQNSVTVCWNSEEKRMSTVNNEELKKIRYKSYVYSMSALAIMLQILFHEFVANLKIRQENILIQILTAYTIILVPVSLAYVKVCVTRASELISFINGLFYLKNSSQENSSPQKNTAWHSNPLQKINVLFAWGLFIFLRAFPAMIVFGFHLDNPCKSTLLGWWALPECFSNDFSQFNGNLILKVLMGLPKFGVLFINYLIYSHGFICICFGMNAINILGVLMLQKNLQRLVSSSHQLQYMKNSSIGMVYRELQLLAILGNLILQNSLLIVVVATIFSASISSTVLIQIELTSMNIVATVFFLINGLGSMVFLTICVGGVMVPINARSKEFLENCKRQRCYDHTSLVTSEFRLTQRWLVKFFKSCVPLKTKLGESNFLENLTPLRCIDSVFQITIQLLLLTK
ncbi:unnamed protein product [Orchesella dallaii]|uniref:Odorant receptor n=1 Tax=Orchesella dallaii TaxID=48710 RepID=A0ABP1RVX6_9HEXA